MPEQPPTSDPMATFGPNEWLVDELYDRYRQDKNSVDPAWWDFFADYRPDGGSEASATNGATPSNGHAPAAPAKAAPAATAPA
ncbi:2-oxoglutarate dehydrogenase E1 subunit family protein, partial [Nostocoides japonicum]|uniref:2-oxoglutarate dehydrogenase E1 subunit family protein n=1 Tax=Nostocoides japonicum TaxID=99481 RepID=UPI0038996A86